MTTTTSRLMLATAVTAIASALMLGCNNAPEGERVTQGPVSTAGGQVDDAVITASVKSALLADPAIKSLDISVATRQGEVQLTGTVDNQQQIEQAAQIARAAQGASRVKNELTVK